MKYEADEMSETMIKKISIEVSDKQGHFYYFHYHQCIILNFISITENIKTAIKVILFYYHYDYSLILIREIANLHSTINVLRIADAASSSSLSLGIIITTIISW